MGEAAGGHSDRPVPPSGRNSTLSSVSYGQAEQLVELRNTCRANLLATGVGQRDLRGAPFSAPIYEAVSLQGCQLAPDVRRGDQRRLAEISLAQASPER